MPGRAGRNALFVLGARGEAVDGHIPALGNCYMLLLLRLPSGLPEKSLALFREASVPFVPAADLLLSVFLHSLWVPTPATTSPPLSLTWFGRYKDMQVLHL